jgi:hypothetical protein
MATLNQPTIVAFVADIYFGVRIEQAARELGYGVEWIERQEQVAPDDLHAPARQLGEHLAGPGAALLEKLTMLHPALLIFDLNNASIPWREWIAMVKSAPATRRLPVICFGSHVDGESLRAAQDAGADLVAARSQFYNALAELIQKHARSIDMEALVSACQQPLSAMGIVGLEQFNRGEFFEAHESLETAWNEDRSPGRQLYQAILQVAVAYLQIERQNYRGARKMFLRMRQWLDPLPDRCRGVDVRSLRSNAEIVYTELLALGAERIGEFDCSLFKPVSYDADN